MLMLLLWGAVMPRGPPMLSPWASPLPDIVAVVIPGRADAHDALAVGPCRTLLMMLLLRLVIPQGQGELVCICVHDVRRGRLLLPDTVAVDMTAPHIG